MHNQDKAAEEWIEIEELEIKSKVGVPEEERQNPQRLTVSLRFQIPSSFESLADECARTIDYSAVAEEVSAIAASSSSALIETLAFGIAERLMDRFPITRLEVVLRKFILPNARYVSVRTVRTRAGRKNHAS